MEKIEKHMLAFLPIENGFKKRDKSSIDYYGGKQALLPHSELTSKGFARSGLAEYF